MKSETVKMAKRGSHVQDGSLPHDSWLSAFFTCLRGGGADGEHEKEQEAAHKAVDESKSGSAASSSSDAQQQKSTSAERSSPVERILSAATFFHVLGLRPPSLLRGAANSCSELYSSEVLRRSYMSLARRVHPDKCDEPAAQEAFFRLQEAFAVLSDADLRALYTQALTDDACGGGGVGGGMGGKGNSACWHSHQRDGVCHSSSDGKPRSFAEAARRARESRSELEQQVKEMLNAQARGRPMARSAASRRAAEERAGRERARKERIDAAERVRQREAAKRREDAERALQQARSRMLAPKAMKPLVKPQQTADGIWVSHVMSGRPRASQEANDLPTGAMPAQAWTSEYEPSEATLQA